MYNKTMEFEYNTLDVQTFEEVYTSVGWPALNREQVEAALQNSYLSIVCKDQGKAVGIIRIIGDGSLAFFIKNFVVIPEYQSKGVGKQLLEKAEEYIRNSLPEDWSYIIELISSTTAEGFYEKMGYDKCPHGFEGPGMYKMSYGKNESSV